MTGPRPNHNARELLDAGFSAGMIACAIRGVGAESRLVATPAADGEWRLDLRRTEQVERSWTFDGLTDLVDAAAVIVRLADGPRTWGDLVADIDPDQLRRGLNLVGAVKVPHKPGGMLRAFALDAGGGSL